MFLLFVILVVVVEIEINIVISFGDGVSCTVEPVCLCFMRNLNCIRRSFCRSSIIHQCYRPRIVREIDIDSLVSIIRLIPEFGVFLLVVFTIILISPMEISARDIDRFFVPFAIIDMCYIIFRCGCGNRDTPVIHRFHICLDIIESTFGSTACFWKAIYNIVAAGTTSLSTYDTVLINTYALSNLNASKFVSGCNRKGVSFYIINLKASIFKSVTIVYFIAKI